MERVAGSRQGGDITRSRILDAAIQEFALKGYDGTTVRQIGRNEGIPLSLIQYHFGSKDELYRAVIHYVLDRVLEERRAGLRDAAGATGGVEARLVAVFLSYVRPHLEATSGPRGYEYSRLARDLYNSGGVVAIETWSIIKDIRLEFAAQLQAILPQCSTDFLLDTLDSLAVVMLSKSAHYAESSRRRPETERRLGAEAVALHCARLIAGGTLSVLGM